MTLVAIGCLMLVSFCFLPNILSDSSYSIAMLLVFRGGWIYLDYCRVWLTEQRYTPSLMLILKFIRLNDQSKDSQSIRRSERKDLEGTVRVAFKKVNLNSYQRPILKDVSFNLTSQ